MSLAAYFALIQFQFITPGLCWGDSVHAGDIIRFPLVSETSYTLELCIREFC